MSNRKQEVCRDFQRGSCRFGARCKFLHQNPLPNLRSRSDFGTQRQVGGNYFDALSDKRNVPGQPPPQATTNDHKCSDLRLCKGRIQEDFANEYPAFWRLTSYAHWKYLPNDICGDVSFEELRSLAYESAKHGSSISDVIQKERAMFAAKSSEFEALLKNQYTGPASRSLSALPTVPFNMPSFSNFSQPATRTLFGKAVPLNSMLTEPTSAQSANPFVSPTIGGNQDLQASGGFSGGFGKGPNSGFSGGAFPFQQQSSSAFNSPFSSAVQPSQSVPQARNLFGVTNPPTLSGFGSSLTGGMTPISPESNLQPLLGGHASSNTFGVSELSSTELTTSVSGTQAFATTNMMLSELVPSEALKTEVPAVSDIWLAEKWSIGEIPEEEPPMYARR